MIPDDSHTILDKYKYVLEFMNRQAKIIYGKPWDSTMPSIIDAYISQHGWSKRDGIYYKDNYEQEEIDLDNVTLMVEI